MCLFSGKAAVYSEFGRGLRFWRRALEVNVEPELKGKVMPAFIGEVGAQFPCVAFSQCLRSEMEAFCQKSNVITILLAVSLQLGQNQIVRVRGVKVQVFEPAGVHLGEPCFVVLRQGNGRDMLKI